MLQVFGMNKNKKKFLFKKLFLLHKKNLSNVLFSRITIFGAEELNFWVRDGARCTLFAIVTEKSREIIL